MGILMEKPKFLRRRRAGRKKRRIFFFVQDRAMLRDQFRRRFGNKGLREAWQDYQRENRGKRKLITFTETR